MRRSQSTCDYFNAYSNSTAQPQSEPADSASDKFRLLHGCDGLLLLRNEVSKKCLIWNPSLALVLHLPDPHPGSYAFALSYIRAGRCYKIFSIYRDKESCIHGWEVLTPGHSMAWTRSTIPEIVWNDKQGKRKLKVVPAGSAVHCIQVSELGRKIVTLDLETECFTVNHCDMKSAWDFDWDGKLALADIVGRNLELMELEDYKKQRWYGNKKIIPLPFLDDDDDQANNIVPMFMKEGEIWFWLKDLYT